MEALRLKISEIDIVDIFFLVLSIVAFAYSLVFLFLVLKSYRREQGIEKKRAVELAGYTDPVEYNHNRTSIFLKELEELSEEWDSSVSFIRPYAWFMGAYLVVAVIPYTILAVAF
jgi:hypothetical protein